MSDQSDSEDSLVEFDWQVRCQGSLVIEVFKRLEFRYDPEWQTRHETNSASTTQEAVEIESKEVLYDRLHQCLLPLLWQHITTLEALLDAEGLQREPVSKLKLLSKLASEIDRNLTQVISAVIVICPETLSEAEAEAEADDHQLKQFKVYRLVELRKMMYEHVLTVGRVFYETHEHIQRLGLSTSSRWFDDEEGSAIEQATMEALDNIETFIEDLKRSDLDIADDVWKAWFPFFNLLLLSAIKLFMPTTADTNRLWYSARTLVHEPLINLVRSAIPIIKLSKLFFYKLSSKGMNRSRSFMGDLYTEINSNQLNDFCEGARVVSHLITRFFCSISRADMNFGEGPIRTRSLVDDTERLASHFDNLSLLLVRYLIPLIQETDPLGPEQNYYKDWFGTWNAQFKLAIHRFLQLISHLED
ncbi:hypothetical protein PSTG_00136 [Puccinia striiformis f. sp. tritici PST-78]|uniref:Uncharacterized protein n=1 Tax=Puccinia striiformis f. sp. tritici PST-78 TaxID=1165861 RepID=A0A0L0W5M4_9BASI|nr:hypothetical protein PSTG_00136 [Puccinia striiformis f. sp. tritici PST-78]